MDKAYAKDFGVVGKIQSIKEQKNILNKEINTGFHMDIPDGFLDIVKLVMKERPKKINGSAIWDYYLQAALIGGGRSEADISFLINKLKKPGLLKLENLNKMSGDKWSSDVKDVLEKVLAKLDYEEDKLVVTNFLKYLFRNMASMKGSGRFFEKKDLIKKIDEYTKDKESAKEFIDELAEDDDVPGVGRNKAIIWLHSIGRAEDFIPATRQLKSFINNDIGPYYRYYEDDDYFIEKGMEFVEEVQKKIKVSAMDVSRAIYYYIGLKSLIQKGFRKKFTCTVFLKYLKSRKLSIKTLQSDLGKTDKRYKLMEDVNKYIFTLKV